MTLVTNSFEGGSDGTTITTGNSGGASGTAFDGVNRDATGTPGVVAFSNVQKRGTLSGRFACGSVGAITDVQWSTARGSLTDDFIRAYVYLTNAFTLNEVIVRWFTSGLAEMGRIAWNADRTFSIRDHTDTIIATSSSAPAAATWHRLEAHHFASATVAQITLRIFAGANLEGSSPDETVTSPTFASGNTTTGRVDFGLPQSAASEPSGGFLYLDDIASGGTDWLGPTGTPAFPPRTFSAIPFM